MKLASQNHKQSSQLEEKGERADQQMRKITRIADLIRFASENEESLNVMIQAMENATERSCKQKRTAITPANDGAPANVDAPTSCAVVHTYCNRVMATLDEYNTVLSVRKQVRGADT